MNRTYDIEISYLWREKAAGRLIVSDRSLYGSDDHFIRLDLYPLIAPSHKRRHYGWWDIPLSYIRHESTSFVLDFSGRTIRLKRWGFPGKIIEGWRGAIEEDGHCMLHVSLWDRSKETPHMVEVKSYPLVIAMRGIDLKLKQINIPMTDRCNLRCTMCPRQNTTELVEVDIPDDVLRPLLDVSPELSCILLQGLGEPLLYRNLHKVATQLKSGMRGDAEVGMTTNATLLDEKIALQLLDSGLDFVYFSVDAASKSTYEAIRIGADFDSVIRNIGQFAHLRSVNGMRKPRLMMNFVMTKHNLQEIAAFAGLAGRLGVENVSYSHCLGADPGKMEIVDKNELLLQFETATKIAENRDGLNIYFPPLEKTREERCFFMERAVILTKGDVIPCHAMAPGYSTRERTITFGNVSRSSLMDIWKQSDYREFRSSVLRGDYPSKCDGCECKAYLVP